MTKRGPRKEEAPPRRWWRAALLAPAALCLFVGVCIACLRLQVEFDFIDRAAPQNLPVAVSSRNTYDRSVFPPEYEAFYRRSRNETAASELIPLWVRAMEEYYAAYSNLSAAGRTAHRTPALLPLFTTTRPADRAKRHFAWLAYLLPWYPPFLVGYAHLLEDKRGFGTEEGRGLFSRPRYLSYVKETDACQSRLNRIALWPAYAASVRVVEALHSHIKLAHLARIARLLLFFGEALALPLRLGVYVGETVADVVHTFIG